MAFHRVNSVRIRPDRVAPFQEQIIALAAAAGKKKEPWRWTAHQTVFGEGLAIHFASRGETFQDIEQQGAVEELWLRVMGDSRGREAFARTNECIQDLRQTISVQRPDLSYAEDVGDPTEYPYAVVTSARARPGHTEALEELIRKVAEAIPKVDDPARLVAYQVVFGEMGAYYTVRPLRSLADLDRQLPAPELLAKAFGNGEGGLLWRNGSEATEQARREVVRYLPELSNPPLG